MSEFFGTIAEFVAYLIVLAILSVPVGFFARVAYEAGKIGWGLL